MANNVRVEIYYDAAWHDIAATNVRLPDKITISRGGTEERSTVSAAQCALTINNANGTYSNRNPNSPLYGKIGRNTPIRVRIEDVFVTPSVRATQTATSSNTSGVTVAKPTVVAGDIMLAFHASNGVLASMSPIEARWQLLASVEATGPTLAGNVYWRTANDNEPASYTFNTAGGTYSVATVVSIQNAADCAPVVGIPSTELNPSTTFDSPSFTPQANNDLDVRFVAGTDAVGVAGVTFTPPTGYSEIADSQAGSFTVASVATKALTSNAAPGVKTFTCSSSALDQAVGFSVSIMPDCERFHGEVAEWPQQWDRSGRDVWVPIEASSYLARMNQGAKALRSAMARGVPKLSPVGYWPMEDGTNATSFASLATGSAVTGGYRMALTGSTGFNLASDDGPDGSDKLPKPALGTYFTGGLAFPGGNSSAAVTAAGYTIQWAMKVPQLPGAGASWVLMQWWMSWNTGGIATIQVWLTDTGKIIIRGYDFVGTELFSDTGGNFQGVGLPSVYGTWHLWRFDMDNSGGNFNGTIRWSPDGTNIQSHSVSRASSQCIAPFKIQHPGSGQSVGHLAVFAGTVAGQYSMMNGWTGETAGRRIERLCTEEGVSLTTAGDLDATAAMGPQTVDKLPTLLQHAAGADQGILFEQRCNLGLSYRTLGSLYNQTAQAALSYTSRHLSGDLEPTDDDQRLWNDVTAQRPDGSSFTTTATTGPLSIQPPPDGVGDYDRGPQTVHVASDDDLPDWAGWTKHVGTWDEARYPAVSANFANPAWTGNLTLTRSVALADTGDLITVSSLPAWMPPDTVGLLVAGYKETISQADVTRGWDITWNATPAGPYTVAVLDSNATGKLDTYGTVLAAAATSGATSLKLATRAGTLWTEAAGSYPFDLKVAGERVTATAMTHTAWTFVSVGTASHAVNASVTPGTPASRAVGDLLLIFAAIRNSGTGTVNTPAGYTPFLVSGNMALFGRIATNTAADLPTVSFSGGVANGDTSAQMSCFRSSLYDASKLVVASAAQLNGSAQNMATPFLAKPTYPIGTARNNCLVITLGWKQATWTSVAALTGFTAIASATTVTGDDQSIVWDYQIQTTSTDIAGTSFVVTGGISAISRTAVVEIGYDLQTATVTRSVNGIVKAQPAGEALSLWQPAVLAR